MDEKTARKYLKEGKLPSQMRWPRQWRTHPDAFAGVWEEVERILKCSPTVQAKTLFEYLCREHEGKFQQGQLRTLQRRIQNWRALHGEPKEVMFPQHHLPGQQCQSDFTWMNALNITISGVQFDHLLYHFVLSYSNWETVTVCFSESFESLSAGLQNALWELGALPAEHRTDRMSAAVNNLNAREEFTQRYEGLLEHYGMAASRTQAGRAHELGDAEQSHYRFKQAVDQELLLRGSRDFSNRRDYEDFVGRLVKRRNAMRQNKFEQELEVMRPLPAGRIEDFSRQWVKVSRNSTIRIRHNLYSVDSRLIGERVEVRIFPDHLEIYYGGRRLESVERLRGEGKHRIQYRHIIHSLVRKPGAFRRYRYRQDLFPRIVFRIAYDELCRDCPQTADRQYLRILLAAAEQSEERVAEVLRHLIEKGEAIRQERVLQLLDSETRGSEPWQVKVGPVKVSLYDRLLDTPQEVRT
jgi:hypothetical protein